MIKDKYTKYDNKDIISKFFIYIDTFDVVVITFAL